MDVDISPGTSSSLDRPDPKDFPGVPQYAQDHAPLFYLHPKDKYRPTDLSTFLRHVRPQINYEEVQPIHPPPTLGNLDDWITRGRNRGEDIYFTSRDDVTQHPAWLRGVNMIDDIGGMYSSRPGCIIVVDRGEGVVDVFYFMFWAFNFGGTVLSQNLGNHVGDWEHVMIRFEGGRPKLVWLSQHGNGEAYAFDALEKNASGQRPQLYIAIGSHAIYARTGDVDHTIPNLNTTIPFLLVDQCALGPMVDPLLCSYIYSYSPKNRNDSIISIQSNITRRASNKDDNPLAGTFVPLNTWTPLPGWLRFTGHWGDQQYDKDDGRQQSLFSFYKYVDGPTGPAYKQLVRKHVWPANSFSSGQIVRTSLDGSTRLRDQLKRWGWKITGKNKTLQVQGSPRRIYTDRTDARDKQVEARQESLVAGVRRRLRSWQGFGNGHHGHGNGQQNAQVPQIKVTTATTTVSV